MSESAMSEPVYMLNALWFKADGGAETYQRYIEAVTPLLVEHGARLVEGSYIPDQALIGDFDADLVFFVEWPSWEVFQTFAAGETYQRDIRPLREAAIDKSLLIRCRRTPIG